jgi:hypothetical protein
MWKFCSKIELQKEITLKESGKRLVSEKNSWFRVFGSKPFVKSQHFWSIQIVKIPDQVAKNISFGICTEPIWNIQKSKRKFLANDMHVHGFYGLCGDAEKLKMKLNEG